MFGIRRPQLILLIIVVAGVLFPFEWLGEHWPPLGTTLIWAFNDDREHAIGHIALFFTLGVLALTTFPQLRRNPLVYCSALFAVALGQEAFQLAFKGRSLALDDFRDLAVDLIAILLAYALVLV